MSGPNDSRYIISFPCGSDYEMLLFGKTKKKHLGDLPPMHGIRPGPSNPNKPYIAEMSPLLPY